MVPWRLNKRFLKEEEEKLKKLSRTLEKTALEVSNDLENSGACQHALEDDDQILFQRYCHVYKEGELEDLCSRYDFVFTIAFLCE